MNKGRRSKYDLIFSMKMTANISNLGLSYVISMGSSDFCHGALVAVLKNLATFTLGAWLFRNRRCWHLYPRPKILHHCRESGQRRFVHYKFCSHAGWTSGGASKTTCVHISIIITWNFFGIVSIETGKVEKSLHVLVLWSCLKPKFPEVYVPITLIFSSLSIAMWASQCKSWLVCFSAQTNRLRWQQMSSDRPVVFKSECRKAKEV